MSVRSEIADGLVTLISGVVTYSRKVIAIKEFEDITEHAQNPPFIFVLYIRSSAIEETRVGHPVQQRRRFEYLIGCVSKTLQATGGQDKTNGIYDMLDDVSTAVLGKEPPLYPLWGPFLGGDDRILEGFNPPLIAHGAVYNCIQNVTEA